jgi:hypothetical protein
VQIEQRGGPVVTVATPYDADLAKINAELARTTLVYGHSEMRTKAKGNLAKAAGLPAPVAADRAGFAGRTGMAASYDLLDNIKNGKVKLDKLKKEELPEELQKLTLDEQRAYLEKLDKRRSELLKEAGELDKKRGAFIAKKLSEDDKNRARDSFDNQVLRVLEQQARRVNIEYATDDGKKR